jgi:hypothetical protein
MREWHTVSSPTVNVLHVLVRGSKGDRQNTFINKQQDVVNPRCTWKRAWGGDWGMLAHDPHAYWHTETGPSPTTANAKSITTVSIYMICFFYLSRYFCAEWCAGRNVAMRSYLRQIPSERSKQCSESCAKADSPKYDTTNHVNCAFLFFVCRPDCSWLLVSIMQLAVS